MCYNIDLSYGKDFAYTDNGDSTATLTYSLTKEMATEFADIYVYQIYGEEYYGLFAYADSAEVNEAKVTVIIDTETHCFISHFVKIDAKFVIEGETVTLSKGRFLISYLIIYSPIITYLTLTYQKALVFCRKRRKDFQF